MDIVSAKVLWFQFLPKRRGWGIFPPLIDGQIANRREEKAYTTTTERKIFWGTFLASKKNFPGRWWIQKPDETRKTISTTKIFPLWPPFFFGKEKFCTGAGRCMLSFFPAVANRYVQRTTRSTLASHSAVPCGTNVKRMNANRAIRIAAQRTHGL